MTPYVSDPSCLVWRAYGVATLSRLLEIIGLFYKRASSKRPYSAQENYDVIHVCMHHV